MKRNGPRTRNAFEDLGFSAREAQHLQVRAELLVALQQAIARGHMKQADVAKVLGITQPRVSNLLRGRLDLFSTDALIELLGRLGIGVRFSLKPPRKRGRVA